MMRCRLGAFVASGDRPHGGAVRGRGRLDRERLHAAREERLAHDRVLDEVEHVRRVAPQLSGGRIAHLSAQLAPRRAPVAAVAHRVGPAQEARRRHRARLRARRGRRGRHRRTAVRAARAWPRQTSLRSSMAARSGSVIRRTTDAASSACRHTGFSMSCQIQPGQLRHDACHGRLLETRDPDAPPSLRPPE